MPYVGRISTYRPNEHYGFIDLRSVTKDGSMHDLQTAHDIYVHQDDCGSALSQGAQVVFEVVPDQRRGGDSLRAVDVEAQTALSRELVLIDDESGESRALTDPRSLYVPPTPAQRILMKPVAPEEVERVLINRPMPQVPRTSGERIGDSDEITRRILKRVFPQFYVIHENGADMADESFDEVIKQAVEDHRSLGMQAQAAHMMDQAKIYSTMRTLLRTEEELLRPETFIPIQYLPDLFMAVPVWYFWTDQRTRQEAERLQKEEDPQVHGRLRHFCDLIPNGCWADTFLMYNRRMRTLADYQGDVIPPRIIARMRKMAELCDYMVIMTPYHDVAGNDWSNLQWLRSIDPYVIGFLKGVPLMFVLGRFSDSGTFPLYSELVADTIAFLRANINKLQGFNRVQNPYWYGLSCDGANTRSNLGDHLIRHTQQLLTAFDAGNLFDWLRGDGNLPART